MKSEQRFIYSEAVREAALQKIRELEEGCGITVYSIRCLRPLIQQIRARFGDAYECRMIEEGPRLWRLRIQRASLE